MNVVLCYNDYATKIVDCLPSNEGRQSMVMGLINAYELFQDCRIVDLKIAGKRDLVRFHDKQFVDVLLSPQPSDDFEIDQVIDPEKFGLTHDCPIFNELPEYAQIVAGSTISCAQHLMKNHDIVINWYGGRHHSHKSKAQGFCYINDIVLGINQLRLKYSNVFYLDLDLHHGDGVENAFKNSSKVTTCSLHRYDVGFYPGSGSLLSNTDSVVNIPLERGLSDNNLQKIIDEIIIPLIELKGPDVLVLQCGCDGLCTDPSREWNLTIEGFSGVIKKIVHHFNLPTLILGGGGYNNPEVAKCWTYITKILSSNEDPLDLIPDHDLIDNYEESGFQFWYNNNKKSKMKDQNTESYIDTIKSFILEKFS